MTAILAIGWTSGFGCSGSDPEPGPFTDKLACPSPDSLPFVPSERGWRVSSNEGEVEGQPRIKHQPADVMTSPATGAAYTDVDGVTPLGTGNLLVRGVMARIESGRGLFADSIGDEHVSAWQYAESTGWVELATTVTSQSSSSDPGAFSIETSSAGLEGLDHVVRYSVLNAEGSCGIHNVFELAAGRQVVFSDIDATLTATDEEILLQVPDPNYDPLRMGSSVELTGAWAAKGYQMIYLTARPHIFRTETKAWLEKHGYPVGPVITAPDFVFEATARQYKGDWVKRVKEELGWDIVAAYGNAESDIDGYEDAGLDKATTFIVGPQAGTKGTIAIENLDYADHIQTYVMVQPDANHL